MNEARRDRFMDPERRQPGRTEDENPARQEIRRRFGVHITSRNRDFWRDAHGKNFTGATGRRTSSWARGKAKTFTSGAHDVLAYSTCAKYRLGFMRRQDSSSLMAETLAACICKTWAMLEDWSLTRELLRGYDEAPRKVE